MQIDWLYFWFVDQKYASQFSQQQKHSSSEWIESISSLFWKIQVKNSYECDFEYIYSLINLANSPRIFLSRTLRSPLEVGNRKQQSVFEICIYYSSKTFELRHFEKMKQSEITFWKLTWKPSRLTDSFESTSSCNHYNHTSRTYTFLTQILWNICEIATQNIS